jgi:hypothetical protein
MKTESRSCHVDIHRIWIWVRSHTSSGTSTSLIPAIAGNELEDKACERLAVIGTNTSFLIALRSSGTSASNALIHNVRVSSPLPPLSPRARGVLLVNGRECDECVVASVGAGVLEV